MKNLWKLPKRDRNNIAQRKLQLQKQLKDHQESLHRCQNAVSHHEYQIAVIESDLRKLDEI